jgi:hypothetical protein
MQRPLRLSSLVPPGFAVTSASSTADATMVEVHSTGAVVPRAAASIAVIAGALSICRWPGGPYN